MRELPVIDGQDPCRHDLAGWSDRGVALTAPASSWTPSPT